MGGQEGSVKRGGVGASEDVFVAPVPVGRIVSPSCMRLASGVVAVVRGRALAVSRRAGMRGGRARVGRGRHRVSWWGGEQGWRKALRAFVVGACVVEALVVCIRHVSGAGVCGRGWSGLHPVVRLPRAQVRPCAVGFGVCPIVGVVCLSRVRERLGQDDASAEREPKGLPVRELALRDGPSMCVRTVGWRGVDALVCGVRVTYRVGQQFVEERRIGDLHVAVVELTACRNRGTAGRSRADASWLPRLRARVSVMAKLSI